MKPLLVLLIAIFFTQPAQALYRCNGRIQHHPCNNTQVAPQGFGSVSMLKPKRPVNRHQYAKILVSEFEFLPKSEGIWRGRVMGNGKVYLHLQIKRDGKLQSTRYMGKVDLADKSTTFAFRSVTPSGGNWSWDIIASNG